MRSLKLLLGVLFVHGFAPPMPRVDRRAVALNFDAATAAADILLDGNPSDGDYSPRL